MLPMAAATAKQTAGIMLPGIREAPGRASSVRTPSFRAQSPRSLFPSRTAFLLAPIPIDALQNSVAGEPCVTSAETLRPASANLSCMQGACISIAYFLPAPRRRPADPRRTGAGISPTLPKPRDMG